MDCPLRALRDVNGVIDVQRTITFRRLQLLCTHCICFIKKMRLLQEADVIIFHIKVLKFIQK